MTKLYLNCHITPGNAYSDGSTQEHIEMYNLMNMVATKLVNVPGLEVRTGGYTKAKDRSEATAQANAWGAKWFISLHSNATSNPETSGVCAFANAGNKDSYQLASEMAQEVSKILGIQILDYQGAKDNVMDGGPNGTNFGEIVKPFGNAILLETFFHTNLVDIGKYRAKKEELATALANVIRKHICPESTVVGEVPFFKDVPPTDTAFREIQTCAKLGLLLGDGNGHYSPDGSVGRRQLASLMLKAYLAGKEGR